MSWINDFFNEKDVKKEASIPEEKVIDSDIWAADLADVNDIRAKYEAYYQTNERGMITSPGKFEGEMIYMPYFYDMMLDGMGDVEYMNEIEDEEDPQNYSDIDPEGIVTVFDVTPEDIAIFPELEGKTQIRLSENSQGFVTDLNKFASKKEAAYEVGDDCAKTIEKDYKLRVSGLSDWNLAEMIAERVQAEKGTATVNTNEELEKQLKSVKSDRTAAEKKLLSLIGEHTKVDWKKAFEEFEKAEPVQAKSEDLYLEAPDKKKWNKKETFEEKSDKEKIKDMEGVGKEASKKEATTVREKIKKKVEKMVNEVIEEVVDEAPEIEPKDIPVPMDAPIIDNMPKVDAPEVGPAGHVPDMTGPHGLGKGPGEGKGDGSGMEMEPKEIESKKMSDEASDWISKKIKFLMEEEGKPQDQAIAMAHSMAREKGYDVPEKKSSLKKADALTDTVDRIKEHVETTKERLDTQTKESDQEVESDYQGWPNYETWAVALWLDNEQGLHNTAMDIVHSSKDISKVSQALKEFVEEMQPDLGATLWADLLNGAMADVYWYDIAEHYIAEHYKEPDEKGDYLQESPEEPEASKKDEKEIESKLTKKQITAKFKRKADIASPWKIIRDENGEEVIARVSPLKREKLSKEKKLHDKKSK